MQSENIFCIFKMPLTGNHNLTICFKFDSNERQQKKKYLKRNHDSIIYLLFYLLVFETNMKL